MPGMRETIPVSQMKEPSTDNQAGSDGGVLVWDSSHKLYCIILFSVPRTDDITSLLSGKPFCVLCCLSWRSVNKRKKQKELSTAWFHWRCLQVGPNQQYKIISNGENNQEYNSQEIQ